jgi:hypothetical protein
MRFSNTAAAPPNYLDDIVYSCMRTPTSIDKVPSRVRIDQRKISAQAQNFIKLTLCKSVIIIKIYQRRPFLKTYD